MAVCIAIPAAAQQASDPILRVEIGDHASSIVGLAVSEDGKWIATASTDQTVRIWTANQLDLVRIIRMPVGPEREGAVHSVAFTPDGNTLAATGRTGAWESATGPWCIYLLDVGSGDITRRICDLPSVPNRLAYSYDGAYLAVALKCANPGVASETCPGRAGVRVYRTADYSLQMVDTADDDTYSLEFARDGRLLTGSFDGKLRLYGKDLTLIKSEAAPERRKPLSASFSPDGTQIAVGYAEPEADDPPWGPRIDVLSAADLSPLFRPDVRSINHGAMWRVAWAADGKTLYATGTWERGDRLPVLRWTEGGRGRPGPPVALAAARVVDMRSIRDGGIAFAGGTHLAVLGANDKIAAERLAPVPNYRDIGPRLMASRDGTIVQFAFEPFGGKPAYFSFNRRELEMGEAPARSGMSPPLTEHPVLDVRDWDGHYRPTLNGEPLGIQAGDRVTTLAFAREKKTFVIGSGWFIYHFDGAGKRLWKIPVLAAVRGLMVTPDERLVIAALSDGTLRWYAFDTGEPLVTLLPHLVKRPPEPDAQRWVAWTPSGYYMASVEGDSLIGWQINRGRDRAADFFPVSVFRDIYYRPDIVSRIFATLDEGAAIRFADAESGRQRQQRALATLLPPVVSVLAPTNGTELTIPRIAVHYELRAASGEPIKTIEVRANGRPLAVIERGPDAPLPQRGSIEVYVPRQEVTLEVVAQTQSGIWSAPGTARLRWAGPQSDEQPSLYVLAVGVSQYQEAALSLRYADKDARDFVALLHGQEGRRYRQVKFNEPLQNQGAQIAAIRTGLRWLEANTTSRDVAMVFLAGHGTEDSSGQYFFLPYEANKANVFQRGLSYSELRSALARIPGKVFLFLDTCRAGAVGNALAYADMARIANDLRNTEYSVVVFASSTGAQDSVESAEWQNGAFTKAVLAGLSGKAPQRDGYVTTLGLSYFVSGEVPRLTSERQRPVFGQPVSADFSLAKVAK